MKAIKFKESDYYSVELFRGSYLVDGKVLSVENNKSNIQVKDIENVIPIKRKTVVSKYVCGESEMSVIAYNDTNQELLSKSNVDEYDDRVWNSLEDEFKWRKFTASWVPVYREIEVKDDPYSFEIVESQIETGNPYISSDYMNGGKDPLLFIYNRHSAVMNIVRDKFNSLGMSFGGKMSYGETKNVKKWGNSDHSCIRYAVAFNKFPFGDKWGISHNPRGTLDKMIGMYNSDKEQLEEIIQLGYNEHFGDIDNNSFNFNSLLDTLRHCKNLLTDVEPKQRSYSNYSSSFSKLNEAIKQIETSFKAK